MSTIKDPGRLVPQTAAAKARAEKAIQYARGLTLPWAFDFVLQEGKPVVRPRVPASTRVARVLGFWQNRPDRRKRFVGMDVFADGQTFLIGGYAAGNDGSSPLEIAYQRPGEADFGALVRDVAGMSVDGRDAPDPPARVPAHSPALVQAFYQHPSKARVGLPGDTPLAALRRACRHVLAVDANGAALYVIDGWRLLAMPSVDGSAPLSAVVAVY